MIDVKGAFDHVHRDTLIGILEKMALPSKAVSGCIISYRKEKPPWL